MSETRRRYNSYANPFLDWIREQKELSSYDGWRVYDVDGLKWNKHTKKMMLIETKSHGVTIDGVKADQKFTLEVVTRAMMKGTDMKFVGTFLLTFENSGPLDGWTKITYFDGETWKPGVRKLTAPELVAWFKHMLGCSP